MKKTLPVILLIFALAVTGCASQATDTPTPLPATETTAPAATHTALPATPIEADPSNNWKYYTHGAFGLSFEYPAGWFGPDEYVSEDTLRVAVGSDVVYPYGTDRTEQIYQDRDSYYVVIQYSKNDQNQYWKETYQSLVNLQDGESLSDARSQVIKVRDLNLGKFKGIEYISTLSETAQTEPVYTRQVILFDDQSNLLSIMGSPNNVEVNPEAGWREAYQKVDEAYLAIFHMILESITTE